MLQNVLASAGLKPKVCADLLGIDHRIFHEWVMGQRPIPGYIVPELSSVLGVHPQVITSTKAVASGGVENAPAVWFKFREGEKLTDSDREVVVLIRKLGYFIDQLEEITQSKIIVWRVLFDTIRSTREKQAAFREQGRSAAKAFRGARQFGHAAQALGGVIKGLGDDIRGNLRSLGILVIESPVQKSELEGCSFLVGPPGGERPCIFANTYKQRWFRRNKVLVHELAHAIFDIEDEAAMLDFKGEEELRRSEERRADAFAQELFAPKEALHHIAQTKGLRWNALTARDIATLIAYTQVEQRAVLRAAEEAGFISPEQVQTYSKIETDGELKELTERALDTREYLERKGLASTAEWIAEKRTTTVPSRSLRLPVAYVQKVLELAKCAKITDRKAMEFLMVDEDTFRKRYGRLLEEVAV